MLRLWNIRFREGNRKMDSKDRPYGGGDGSLPLPSSSELRGRQSVRATFRLTEQAINTVSIVASHLGIKQKSLFDHLIEDTRSLHLIARRIRTRHFEKTGRIQKTYVLSRKTIARLSEAAMKFDAPRDALVEYSIQRLLPIIAEEREKHEKRKTVLSELTDFLDSGERLLRKAHTLLGEEDPVCGKLEAAVSACRNARKDVQAFVDKGRVIEERAL